jgi:hypothetical protein
MWRAGHTGYFIDEDKLDEMMIQIDNGGPDAGIKYVDIRQDTVK